MTAVLDHNFTRTARTGAAPSRQAPAAERRNEAAGEFLTLDEARVQVVAAARAERKAHKLDSLLLEAKSRQAVFTWPENLQPH